ncbi:MAG: LysM peptidoglycan-binding domain-containing protein [Desulfurivibrionaceae bacterium]|nr:LysM peptidoglycan-binding domain-containing protein [Desulfurivibrionaceae bacterium]
MAMTGNDPFPVHASMRPNVEFWEKVYSAYPSTKGVLHDSKNLAIIYEVIDLAPHGYGSRQVNRRRVKQAKERYQAMLARFAQGTPPKTGIERHVYGMFGPSPTRDAFRRARDDIRCQTGQKDRFLAGLKRSGKYLERLQDIFRNQGLPEDLVYLPHVESSYNYEAYSKFGAAGIWQFTRATGKRFMQVDYAVDERRDPIVASHAAARFLAANHELLGNWPLALTAYNHGPTGMVRAVREKGSYARIFDEYDGKRFGFASRNFYAEFIAARHVAKNYKKYFGNISLDKPVAYHTIEMAGYAPAATIADFFHVRVDEIRRVNPALRPPVFDGQKHIPKGYRLRLPGQAQKMARMSMALPSSLFEKSQKRLQFYRVQRGDTAGKIARRHKVSINELVAANGLSRKATIYVGQNLNIPGSGRKATMVASAAPSRRQNQGVPTLATLKGKVMARALEEERSDAAPVGSLAKWRPQGNPQGMIAAREEERPLRPLVARTVKKRVVATQMPTVADVPRLSPVVVADLSEGLLSLSAPQQESELLTSSVKVEPSPSLAAEQQGRSLITETADLGREEEIVVAEETALEVAEAGEAGGEINPLVLVGNFDVARLKTVKGSPTGTIQVEVEETLGHYADWLEIPTHKIRSLNRYRFGRAIRYGQELQLPFAKVSKDNFEERRYLYHKELVEDFFVAYRVESETSYRVKKGDTLWSLCHDEFELPFWLIKQYNAGFDFHAMRLGSEIKVPVVTEIDADSHVAEVIPVPLAGRSLAKNMTPL